MTSEPMTENRRGEIETMAIGEPVAALDFASSRWAPARLFGVGGWLRPDCVMAAAELSGLSRKRLGPDPRHDDEPLAMGSRRRSPRQSPTSLARARPIDGRGALIWGGREVHLHKIGAFCIGGEAPAKHAKDGLRHRHRRHWRHRQPFLQTTPNSASERRQKHLP
jgi:hypothetical protein